MQKWGPNDRNRPEPPIITPGTASTQDASGESSLGCHRALQWQGFVELGRASKGGPAKWTVGDGYFATVPGTG